MKKASGNSGRAPHPANATFIVYLMVGLLSFGCASRAATIEKKENLLLAAGFIARPANTTERQKMLAALPAYQFIRRPKGDQFIYIFADPTVCACLYIGNEKAISAYQESRYDRQLVGDERADTANLQHQELRDDQLKVQLIEDQNWDWGPWGPGW